jgi:hypothetical protein
MSFFSHLVLRASDSSWEDEAPLTVELALDYLSGEFSEEELTGDSSSVFHAERLLDELSLPRGPQTLISLSGYRKDASSDEISSIRLDVTSSTSRGGIAYPLAVYVAEAPTLSELRLFLKVFNESLKQTLPALLAGYMTRTLGTAYTVRPWEYIPTLFDRYTVPLRGNMYYLPEGRTMVSWRPVEVLDIRYERESDPDQVSVLVKDEETEEEFWVPASYLYTAI